MSVTTFVLAYCSSVIWVWLAIRLATRRGRRITPWACTAAILGPFAVVALFLLPARPSQMSWIAQQ